MPLHVQIKFTIPISISVCNCHFIFVLLFTNLCFSLYPLTFLPPIENQNLSNSQMYQLARNRSFFKINFQIPFPGCSFFPPELAFASYSRAGSFTHFIIVPLSALLDNGNSFMKSSSNTDFFSLAQLTNYCHSHFRSTTLVIRTVTPVCLVPQTTAHTCLAVSSKTFPGCIKENKL